MPPMLEAPDIFVVIGGEAERDVALRMVHRLRCGGYRVEYPLKIVGFGKQFRIAGQSGARVALIIGEDERVAGKVKLRDMRDGGETLLPIDQVDNWLREHL